MRTTYLTFGFVLAALTSLLGCESTSHLKKSMGVTSTPAVYGYDTVAYHTTNQAVRGSGMHAADFNGETYLFSSESNKKLFEQNPSKFTPEFGGYCAYGASVGKKFYSDPTVFAVVDNKLYLNLNSEIQQKWNADQANMIKAGHLKWKSIAN